MAGNQGDNGKREVVTVTNDVRESGTKLSLERNSNTTRFKHPDSPGRYRPTTCGLATWMWQLRVLAEDWTGLTALNE